MSRQISFAFGEYYHLYNRGNSKQDIFIIESDYDRFERLLLLANDYLPIDKPHLTDEKFSIRSTKTVDSSTREPLVDIGAYCLMKNHFHLLVREKQENGISNFMHKLSTAYVMYFNCKHERTGALFEGPFRAKHVTDDQVLCYLFAYIHLNPIKLIDPKWRELGIGNRDRAVKFLKTYKHSSYIDYTAKQNFNTILNPRAFPKYFEQPKTFQNFIKDWLLYHNNT